MEATLTGESRVLRTEDGKFKAGTPSPNPQGRSAGVKDKANQIKMAFLQAFEETGGLEGLITWINKSSLNKREFYKLMLNILPKELQIEGDFVRDRTLIVQFGQPRPEPACAEPEVSARDAQVAQGSN